MTSPVLFLLPISLALVALFCFEEPSKHELDTTISFKNFQIKNFHHLDQMSNVNESMVEHICLNDGIHGSMMDQALVSLFVVPARTMSSTALQSLLFSYVKIHINVIITSQSCSHLLLASQLGLPTLRLKADSDIEALTYRHLFSIAQQNAPTQLVGVVFSAIEFDESLDVTLNSVMSHSTDVSWQRFLLFGRSQSMGERLSKISRKEKTSFEYFLFQPPLDINWKKELPEFVIGAPVFGPWFISWCIANKAINVIDVSETLLARKRPMSNADVLKVTAAEEINGILARSNRIVNARRTRVRTRRMKNGTIYVATK